MSPILTSDGTVIGYYQAPIGCLCLSVRYGSVRALTWSETAAPVAAASGVMPPVLQQAMDWLDSYFGGAFCPIDFPIEPEGTLFQRRVWQLVATVPVATTVSYGTLAHRLGSHARAVGHAMAANPVPLLIPCHRVTGKRGLGGYSGAGGTATKQWLLQWEQRTLG
ncbi:MAG: methylated-DNA--[protein]-cysteine S-methyltransferase [Magnetococcales bacterium]|nr:methylated-DNA--[protein]-cysteine S-methyltransferase [Magnetococcales bacterium]